MSVVRNFLCPAFIPEDLESILLVAAEGKEVNKHSDNNKYSLMDSWWVSRAAF